MVAWRRSTKLYGKGGREEASCSEEVPRRRSARTFEQAKGGKSGPRMKTQGWFQEELVVLWGFSGRWVVGRIMGTKARIIFMAALISRVCMVCISQIVF